MKTLLFRTQFCPINGVQRTTKELSNKNIAPDDRATMVTLQCMDISREHLHQYEKANNLTNNIKIDTQNVITKHNEIESAKESKMQAQLQAQQKIQDDLDKNNQKGMEMDY